MQIGKYPNSLCTQESNGNDSKGMELVVYLTPNDSQIRNLSLKQADNGVERSKERAIEDDQAD
jgi:uncharacterized protein YpmB